MSNLNHNIMFKINNVSDLIIFENDYEHYCNIDIFMFNKNTNFFYLFTQIAFFKKKNIKVKCYIFYYLLYK